MQAIPEIKRWSTTRPPPLLTVNSRQLFSHLQLLPSPDSSYRSGKQVGTLSFSSAPPFTRQQLQEQLSGRDPLLLFSPSLHQTAATEAATGRDTLLLFSPSLHQTAATEAATGRDTLLLFSSSLHQTAATGRDSLRIFPRNKLYDNVDLFNCFLLLQAGVQATPRDYPGHRGQGLPGARCFRLPRFDISTVPIWLCFVFFNVNLSFSPCFGFVSRSRYGLKKGFKC